MRFVSTRGGAPSCGFPEAVLAGLAPDGGLYVPDSLAPIRSARPWPSLGELVDLFVGGELSTGGRRNLAASIEGIPAPLVPLSGAPGAPGGYLLELFHGPTAAFKDFGARFLAACFARLRRDAARPLRILVATSGDTGGAVAAAFHRRPGIEVAVLFPKGLVSPTQERQLTVWGDNVSAFALRGTFDEGQKKRLMQVAGRCPVHKTIDGGPRMYETVSFESA